MILNYPENKIGMIGAHFNEQRKKTTSLNTLLKDLINIMNGYIISFVNKNWSTCRYLYTCVYGFNVVHTKCESHL